MVLFFFYAVVTLSLYSCAADNVEEERVGGVFMLPSI